MITAIPQWLPHRTALIVGDGGAANAVGASLVGAGALIVNASASAMDMADIKEALSQGSFDILVHAGVPMSNAAAETINLNAWRATQSADIDGRFLFAAEFVRRRLATGGAGAILFLMPAAALQAGRSASLSAHGALENLVKSLAVEWGRDGIRINGIASHVVENFAAATEAQQRSLGNLAAYLVSDYAAYMTGTISGIDEI